MSTFGAKPSVSLKSVSLEIVTRQGDYAVFRGQPAASSIVAA
jgi:hypothetical protein